MAGQFDDQIGKSDPGVGSPQDPLGQKPLENELLSSPTPRIQDLKYDEEGFYEIDLPEQFEWIVSAQFHEDDKGERIVRIEFRDGFLADVSEEFGHIANSEIKALDGVESVYWEDREYFHIGFSEGKSLIQVLGDIEKLFKEHEEPWD